MDRVMDGVVIPFFATSHATANRQAMVQFPTPSLGFSVILLLMLRVMGNRRNFVINTSHSCFVVHQRLHRRCEHKPDDRCCCKHQCATATASMTLGMSNNSNNNKSHRRRHLQPQAKSTKITTPETRAEMDNNDNANLMQLKLLEARDVEMQLSDAINIMNLIRRRKRKDLPSDQKIEFPSVRQCNAGK
jgi:hypothetical protein